MAQRPQQRRPPRPAAAPARGDIPMARAPFLRAPWGPYDQEVPHKGDVLSGDTGTVDMRGQSAWRSLKTVQCGDYSFGQVIVTCDARASSASGATDLPAWPHVEIRLVARTRNQPYILLEAAAGSHGETTTSGPTASAGPVMMTFGPGEVPDSVEVLARARKGGLPETSFASDEKLDVLAAWRFHP